MATGRIFVLATTPEGTAAALTKASQRMGPGLRVDVLAPQVIRDGGALPDTNSIIEQIAALGRAIGVRVTVYVHVCRSPLDVLGRFLSEQAMVVIGGYARRGWSPTPERRLAREAERLGYRVKFATVAGTTHDE